MKARFGLNLLLLLTSFSHVSLALGATVVDDVLQKKTDAPPYICNSAPILTACRRGTTIGCLELSCISAIVDFDVLCPRDASGSFIGNRCFECRANDLVAEVPCEPQKPYFAECTSADGGDCHAEYSDVNDKCLDPATNRPIEPISEDCLNARSALDACLDACADERALSFG